MSAKGQIADIAEHRRHVPRIAVPSQDRNSMPEEPFGATGSLPLFTFEFNVTLKAWFKLSCHVGRALQRGNGERLFLRELRVPSRFNSSRIGKPNTAILVREPGAQSLVRIPYDAVEPKQNFRHLHERTGIEAAARSCTKPFGPICAISCGDCWLFHRGQIRFGPGRINPGKIGRQCARAPTT